MDKEEKKQTGVSLFGQSERFLGSDQKILQKKSVQKLTKKKDFKIN